MNYETELKWLDMCIEALEQEKEKIDEKIDDLIKLKGKVKSEQLAERMCG